MKRIAAKRNYNNLRKIAYYGQLSTSRGKTYLNWHNDNEWNKLVNAAKLVDVYYVDEKRDEYRIYSNGEYEYTGTVSDASEATDGAIFHPSWK